MAEKLQAVGSVLTLGGKDLNFSGADGITASHTPLFGQHRHQVWLRATNQALCVCTFPINKQQWVVGGDGWGHTSALLPVLADQVTTAA